MDKIGDLVEVILYVQDMNRMVAFYRDKLGLEVRSPRDRSDYATEFWVEMETGSCTLVLHGGGGEVVGEYAPKIVFGVSDIERLRETLLARGVKLGGTRSPAEGVLVVDGVDLEQNKFSLEEHTR
jgi:predicted enzyme related to lactoylglutathione lyase